MQYIWHSSNYKICLVILSPYISHIKITVLLLARKLKLLSSLCFFLSYECLVLMGIQRRERQIIQSKAWNIGLGFPKSYILCIRFISFHGKCNKGFSVILSLPLSPCLLIRSFIYSSGNLWGDFVWIGFTAPKVKFWCLQKSQHRHLKSVLSRRHKLFFGEFNYSILVWIEIERKTTNKCYWQCLINLTI